LSPADTQLTDRRYTFEVVSSTKSTLLQAENESELQDWIKAFECARKLAVEEPDRWLADEARSHRARAMTLTAPHAVDKMDNEDVIENHTLLLADVPKSHTTNDFKYPDRTFERKNDELHVLFPASHVDHNEFVLDGISWF